MTATRIVPQSRARSLEAGARPEAAARPAAWQVIAWLALLCCVVALFLRNVDLFQIGTYSDDAAYVLLARNLLQRHTYGIDLGAATPNVSFPPGYPLLLVPVVSLFPDDLAALRWPSLVATLASATILFWAWRSLVPRSSYSWGLAVTALYSVAPLTSEHTRMVMAEAIFLTLCLIAFVLASRLARGRGSPWLGLLLGADLACAILTRSVGLLLVLFAFLYLGLETVRKRPVDAARPDDLPGRVGPGRRAATLLGCPILGGALVFGAVLILTPVRPQHLLPAQYANILRIPCRIAYMPAFCDAISMAQENKDIAKNPDVPVTQRLRAVLKDYVWGGMVQHFGTDLRTTVLPLGGGRLEQALATRLGWRSLSLDLGYLFALFMFVGALWLARQGNFSPFVAFAPFCFLFVFGWEWSGGRILYPILPQLEFILLGAIGAALAAAGRIMRPPAGMRLRPALLGSIVILLCAGGIYGSLRRGDSRTHIGDLAARSAWIAATARSGEVIATEEPVVDQLYTGRPTTWYPERCESPAQVLEELNRERVVYILVAARIQWQEKFTPQYSEHGQCMVDALAVLAGQGRAELIYSAEQQIVKVFRLENGPRE